MEILEDKAEFISVTTDRLDSVSVFLDLGRDYFSEYEDLPPDFNPGKYLQSILKRQSEPDRWLFLLRHKDKHIGLVHAKIDRDERPGWGYILEFYIVPDKRRYGWGRTMFDFVAEILQSRGTNRIWLASDPNAEAFWYSLGFRETGEMENDQKIMVLSI